MAAAESTNKIIVRSMSKNDLERCAEIFAETYRTVYSEPWTKETGEKRISEIYNSNKELCFVIEKQNKIFGFVIARKFSWYDGNRVWIEEFVIDEKFREKGYGTILFNSLIEKSIEKGMVNFSLISDKNSKAYNYYLKRKYAPSSWVHLEKCEKC